MAFGGHPIPEQQKCRVRSDRAGRGTSEVSRRNQETATEPRSVARHQTVQPDSPIQSGQDHYPEGQTTLTPYILRAGKRPVALLWLLPLAPNGRSSIDFGGRWFLTRTVRFR